VEFNDTVSSYPGDMTINELYERQAEQTPDRVAIVGKGAKIHLSYRELNEKSHQKVRQLIEKGGKPGTIAAIMAEPSVEMIIGMLAVLKAGGAYLPIDPAYPQERIDYMLADSNAEILVTNPGIIKPVGKIDSSAFQLPSFPASDSSNPCCIFYTSGSTGKPKGVMVRHRGVIRLVKNTNFIRWNRGDSLLMTGTIAFDITTFEIWGPLLNGLSLHLTGKDTVRDPGKLAARVIRSSISILHLVPQLFNRELVENPGIYARLKYFLVGGDLVNPGPVNELRKKYKKLKILHMPAGI
jgi:non-ribosomal peptide synthetase component F